MRKEITGLAVVAAAWLTGTGSAFSETYTFIQNVNGYTGASSTYTEYQGAAADPQSSNYGGGQQMLLYSPPGEGAPKKVSMMKFDLDGFSTPMSVGSASLTLYVSGDGSRGEGFSVTNYLYPILRSGLSFGSSQGAIENGTVTFNSAAYDPVAPVRWGGPGNYGPVAGEDYSNTAIGSFTLTSDNAVGGRVTFSLDPGVVESWINDPSSNYGFVIVSDITTVQTVILTGNFDNGGELDWTVRPNLTFEATAIPEPASTAMVGAAGLLTLLLRRRKLKTRRHAATLAIP